MPEKEKTARFGFREVPESEKEENVKEVFDSVAPKYDLMNDLLSFGMHRWWKHRTIAAAAVKAGEKVLDIASGTCDLAIEFAGRAGRTGEVWATDINRSMLSEGVRRLQRSSNRVRTAVCDCEALPFPDAFFDVASVSFGLRNMTHKGRALEEMVRVTKPGGRIFVLEFSHPAKFLRPLYDLYSFHFMPWLGSKVAGDAASYRYLAESIRVHPDQRTLAAMMQDAGMASVTWENMTFGICALHSGVRL